MKKYKSKLKELFINEPQAQTDLEILRISIIAELDASNLYEKLARKCQNENVKKVLLDISKEERVHAGEFRNLIEMIDPEYRETQYQADMEIENLVYNA